MRVRADLFLALVLAIGTAPPAAANDSMAELGAGGLVLAHSDTVSIESETLYLSLDRVQVDYVFRNHSDRDVTSIVAFPMPDIAINPYEETSIPRLEDNFLGFTVETEGYASEPQLQQRAWSAGVDVTDIVLEAGLPLAPLDAYGGLDASHLSQEMLDRLVAWGIVYRQMDPDSGRFEGMVEPAWTLKTSYWWEMTFPAGTDLAVRHTYTPATGASAGLFMLPEGPDGPVTPYYVEKYCTDDGFVNAARRRQKQSMAQGGYGMSEQWLSYVLTSGANWAGPIGQFRLIIDKGSTDNLVSFCGEGVSKIGPTTFQMEKQNFWPESDLDILFLVAQQP